MTVGRCVKEDDVVVGLTISRIGRVVTVDGELTVLVLDAGNTGHVGVEANWCEPVVGVVLVGVLGGAVTGNDPDLALNHARL